jgi:type VI secretion system protein ImpF
MAELTTQERLQPSLLDRLTDDEPGKAEESREKRVISANRLRECVTRDVSWILNCVNMCADEELAEYPEVARSVLNFGVPDLTGSALSGVDVSVLQRQLVFNIASEMWAQPIPLNLYLKTEVDLETGAFHVSEGFG